MGMAPECRHVERGDATPVGSLRIGTCLYQLFCYVEIPHVGRDMKGGPSVGKRLVYPGRAPGEELHHEEIA